MRTTLTLEPDVDRLIRNLMRERGLSMKDAINFAIRAGLRPLGPAQPFQTPTFDLGQPMVPLVKALQVAAEREDEEIARKLGVGK